MWGGGVVWLGWEGCVGVWQEEGIWIPPTHHTLTPPPSQSHCYASLPSQPHPYTSLLSPSHSYILPHHTPMKSAMRLRNGSCTCSCICSYASFAGSRRHFHLFASTFNLKCDYTYVLIISCRLSRRNSSCYLNLTIILLTCKSFLPPSFSGCSPAASPELVELHRLMCYHCSHSVGCKSVKVKGKIE